MNVSRYCLAQTTTTVPEFVAVCVAHLHGFTISTTTKALCVSVFTYFAPSSHAGEAQLDLPGFLLSSIYAVEVDGES